MILKEFVRRLSSHGRRDYDLACRWGGEEFLVLLNGVTLSDAVAFAERFRLYVSENPFEVGNQTLTVTVSIGVAEITLCAPYPERTIKVADDALYQAKLGGRNRVQYIEMPTMP
ncbi:GGDEF domain-containing protein [Rhizobium sp. SL86]|uniref:GGDEF domain-containing protein n=1 Tax=Rhizobium sp. SL86 TaxID=2995148 RepID=UPI00227475C6|nr:GGDEF domain-containing protein [Rhizobium sp. SL86]MCY1667840.1 GGDEF domain-containing protein [Rhizobium sp. SL86]